MRIQNPSNLDKNKVGRNDPCLCGSGKKYKKCCLLNSENFEDKDSLDQAALLQTMGDKVKKQYKDESIMMGTSDELGLDRMSEILLEFAEELLDSAKNDEEKEGIIMMAIIAWNIAIITDEDIESTIDCIDDYLQSLDFKKKSEEKEAVSCVLHALVEKKWIEYPDVQRFIVDFEVIETKDQFRLNVASLVAPVDKSKHSLPTSHKKVKTKGEYFKI
ncbi:MAG: SEC-C domain-containing protein [Alphaproteobacteria bacterium]|nr:SEC-C domain-containing protein [Alphaproteobacteria bacterium]